MYHTQIPFGNLQESQRTLSQLLDQPLHIARHLTPAARQEPDIRTDLRHVPLLISRLFQPLRSEQSWHEPLRLPGIIRDMKRKNEGATMNYTVAPFSMKKVIGFIFLVFWITRFHRNTSVVHCCTVCQPCYDCRINFQVIQRQAFVCIHCRVISPEIIQRVLNELESRKSKASKAHMVCTTDRHGRKGVKA